MSVLETVKHQLHHGNDSGGTSASGAQSHLVPRKEHAERCHFFIQLQKGWMQSICTDKNRNSMEQADDKQADPMEAEKRETDLDEEQLLTREVAASGEELNSKNRG